MVFRPFEIRRRPRDVDRVPLGPDPRVHVLQRTGTGRGAQTRPVRIRPTVCGQSSAMRGSERVERERTRRAADPRIARNATLRTLIWPTLPMPECAGTPEVVNDRETQAPRI